MAQTDGEPSPASPKEGLEVASATAAANPPPLPTAETTLEPPATALPLTIKCSEFAAGGLLKNGSTFLKTKNFKAGSKINRLADMLAKRSLQVVEASENGHDVPFLLPSLITEPAPPLLPPPPAPPLLPPPPAPGEPEEPAPLLLEEAVPLTIPIPSIDPAPSPPPLLPAEDCQTEEPQIPPSPPTAFITSENSTKEKPVKTRSSPRCRKEVDPIQTDSVARRGKTRQVRRNKKLVETSTQTAEIQFIVKEGEESTNSRPVAQEEPPPALTPAVALPLAESSISPLSDAPVLTPIDTSDDAPPIPADTTPLTLANGHTFVCLFCRLTFADKTNCLNHEATHSLKRKTKFIKCQFCPKKLPNLEEFKSHSLKHHGSQFHVCTECDLRFVNDECLVLHTKYEHYNLDLVEKTQFTILNKKVRTGPSLDIDVNCEAGKKPTISPRCAQKLSPKEKTEEQLYEAEMLFYSHLSGNIQENLSKHLDGKIDQYENGSDVVEPARSSCLLTVVPSTSGATSVPVTRAPSPYQTRSKTPNPLPTSAKKFKKLPNWQQKFWEKYNFPTNYRFVHRFWDKNYIHAEQSPVYLKDLSCLDIKTQRTMRENVNKLEESSRVDDDERLKETFPYFLNLIPGTKAVPAEAETVVTSKVETAKVPKKKSGKEGKAARRVRLAGDALSPQVVTRRQSGMDGGRQRKGSLDMGGEKMSLRKQTSLEVLEVDSVEKDSPSTATDNSINSTSAVDTSDTEIPPEGTIITGEWVRPRSYLCGTCCTKFSNLWELEDHKWAAHPNVWCTHYEFEDDKLEKLFQLEAESPQVAKITLPDLYRRYLQPQGSLHLAETVTSPQYPLACTKCQKPCTTQAEQHKHMLDCGGDTTWFLTMCSSPAAMKRRWRPYGSRRRKQIGQRGVKRNIPTTPTLRSYIAQPKVRTKPGDLESIQKMLANLPEKRTRRAINFDEVNTRSQTTIHSNRLLRKRFNVSFGSNFLRRKVLTTVRQRQLKSSSSKSASESSSKTASDASSDTTPSSSPRRRFRLKDVTVSVTPLAITPAMLAPSAVEPNKAGGKKKKQKKRVVKKLAKVTVVEEEPQLDENQALAVTAAEIKMKKRIVERKGYLVKKIKKKLRNSKNLMKVREENTRRSIRLKENQAKGDSEGEDFTAEESELPIAQLNEKKKSPKKPNQKVGNSPELTEMPILNREEPMKRRVLRKSDPDLPVLKPIESVAEGEDVATKETSVRFKVLKKPSKKKASTNVKVSPLKLVKEEDGTLPTESAPKPTVDSGSDSEPLIALKKSAVLAGKIARRKKNGRKWSKAKKKTVLKLMPENLEVEAADQVEAVKEDSPATVITPVPEEQPLEQTIAEPPAVRNEEPEPSNNIDQARFTNFMMERIITDKLNERLVKRKKGVSTHKRGKVQPKHSLKRLRMTVTLKAATLKVLDKPATVPGPNKWTVSAPTSPVIAFQTTPVNAEEKEDGAIVVSKSEEKEVLEEGKNQPEVIAPVVPVPETRPRSSRRLSKNTESENVEIVPMAEEASVIPPLVDAAIPDIPTATMEPVKPTLEPSKPTEVLETETPIGMLEPEKQAETFEPAKPTMKRRRKPRAAAANISTAKVSSRPRRASNEVKETRFILAQPVLKNCWRSAENAGDVSTTVTSVEETKTSPVLRRKPSVSTTVTTEEEKVIAPISSIEEPPPAKVEEVVAPQEVVNDVVSIFTIEEATSSEDALTKKPSVTSTCQAKIAEADSSVEIPVEAPVESHDEKMEPEMVVSSTEPSGGRQVRKRKRKEVTVEFDSKDEVPSSTLLIPEELDRRSRRKSKEVPTSNEFIIDDPLLLVDELWSDLDSDSDSKQKRKVRRVKKRTPKKRTLPSSEVDLEALLRNFGERKEATPDKVKCLPKRRVIPQGLTSRQRIENKIVVVDNSLKRLSLRLFSFNNKILRRGQRGGKLLKVKKILLETLPLPALPFLPSEVTENPEQVIVCHSAKTKVTRKQVEPTVIEEFERKPVVHSYKVSLPLELLGDLSILNNNHTEPTEPPTPECCSRPNTPAAKPPEAKQKRSEVIDKIFYCEICKTYYYSPSHLRNHKMSNRHKLKELELLDGGLLGLEEAVEQQIQTPTLMEEALTPALEETAMEVAVPAVDTPAGDTLFPAVEVPVPAAETSIRTVEPPSVAETAEPEVDKGGDDTSEMPVLEGPFIDTQVTPRPEPQPGPPLAFGFSEESLKDIQKAIGCTDEEMLILTLLGENTVPEPDILDISHFTSKAEADKRANYDAVVNRSGKTNGVIKVDLKERMSSALASLINRALSNFMIKTEGTAKQSDKSDAVVFLNKLSGFSGRRKSVTVGEAVVKPPLTPAVVPVGESSEVRYKYQCTICGNRFEKESTRDYHVVRHRVRKRSKATDKAEIEQEQTPPSDDWNESWYDCDDFSADTSPQFLCSDCGIYFLSPKEVLDHQKAEHPPEPTRPAAVAEPKPPARRVSGLDPDQERLLATQELQKLVARRRLPKELRPKKTQFGMDALKFTKHEANDDSSLAVNLSAQVKVEVKKNPEAAVTKKRLLNLAPDVEQKKSVDVYDFNEFDSDTEPVVFAHIRKSGGKSREAGPEQEDDDSEDNLPLSSVKVPRINCQEPSSDLLTPPEVADISSQLELPQSADNLKETAKESFKISLENRFLRLDEIKLKNHTPSGSEGDDSMPLFDLISKKEAAASNSAPLIAQFPPQDDSDDQIGENVIYQTNDSISSFDSHDPGGEGESSRISESYSSKYDSDNVDSEDDSSRRRQKKIVPLLTATLTNSRNSESPKLNKEVIVNKIWKWQKPKYVDEETQPSEIDKETIMKKIWKKKRVEAEDTETESERFSSEDGRINKMEVSDEVVIKCGPKPKSVNRRRSLNETPKDAIVRRIWSGKCGFQTKAALKTYDSDVIPAPLPSPHMSPPAPSPPPPPPPVLSAAKRRGRQASVSTKRKKASSGSGDDLDSLLEEIEQENVEKAIRLEFLHLRRSEKSQVESPKEPTGLFAEIQPPEVRNTPERKRAKIRKNVQLLKRRQEVNDFLNRRHRKHRHRHHHHKHKHKKSRHHKRILTKHRNKHRPEVEGGGPGPAPRPGEGQGAELEPFRVLERMCEDIVPRGDASPVARRAGAEKLTVPRISSDLDNLDLKLDEILLPFNCTHKVNGDASQDAFGLAEKNVDES